MTEEEQSEDDLTEEPETWNYEQMEVTRLDDFIHAHYPEFTLSKVRKVIKEGIVTLNNEPAKSNWKLHRGDVVRFFPQKLLESSLEPEKMDLEVIYEDEWFAAINKPPGIVVHPAPGNYTGTIVHGLLYHFNELSKGTGKDAPRPGIVHRLDKDTSGVLLIAKSDDAHHKLSALFKARKMRKTYQAVLLGKIREKEGVVTAPIGRAVSDRKKMGVRLDKGREAETAYQILRETDNFLFAEFYPRTGRTHQIRVHAQVLNIPIIGDKIYGPKKFPYQRLVERQMLHARRICFTHPYTGVEVELTAPHFADFRNFMEKVFELQAIP